jgi:hypothetical protein
MLMLTGAVVTRFPARSVTTAVRTCVPLVKVVKRPDDRPLPSLVCMAEVPSTRSSTSAMPLPTSS